MPEFIGLLPGPLTATAVVASLGAIVALQGSSRPAALGGVVVAYLVLGFVLFQLVASLVSLILMLACIALVVTVGFKIWRRN